MKFSNTFKDIVPEIFDITIVCDLQRLHTTDNSFPNLREWTYYTSCKRFKSLLGQPEFESMARYRRCYDRDDLISLPHITDTLVGSTYFTQKDNM